MALRPTTSALPSQPDFKQTANEYYREAIEKHLISSSARKQVLTGCSLAGAATTNDGVLLLAQAADAYEEAPVPGHQLDTFTPEEAPCCSLHTDVQASWRPREIETKAEATAPQTPALTARRSANRRKPLKRSQSDELDSVSPSKRRRLFNILPDLPEETLQTDREGAQPSESLAAAVEPKNEPCVESNQGGGKRRIFETGAKKPAERPKAEKMPEAGWAHASLSEYEAKLGVRINAVVSVLKHAKLPRQRVVEGRLQAWECPLIYNKMAGYLGPKVQAEHLQAVFNNFMRPFVGERKRKAWRALNAEIGEHLWERLHRQSGQPKKKKLETGLRRRAFKPTRSRFGHTSGLVLDSSLADGQTA